EAAVLPLNYARVRTRNGPHLAAEARSGGPMNPESAALRQERTVRRRSQPAAPGELMVPALGARAPPRYICSRGLYRWGFQRRHEPESRSFPWRLAAERCRPPDPPVDRRGCHPDRPRLLAVRHRGFGARDGPAGLLHRVRCGHLGLALFPAG